MKKTYFKSKFAVLLFIATLLLQPSAAHSEPGNPYSHMSTGELQGAVQSLCDQAAALAGQVSSLESELAVVSFNYRVAVSYDIAGDTDWSGQIQKLVKEIERAKALLNQTKAVKLTAKQELGKRSVPKDAAPAPADNESVVKKIKKGEKLADKADEKIKKQKKKLDGLTKDIRGDLGNAWVDDPLTLKNPDELHKYLKNYGNGGTSENIVEEIQAYELLHADILSDHGNFVGSVAEESNFGLSAVVNLQTKGGGNVFSGSVRESVSNNSWVPQVPKKDDPETPPVDKNAPVGKPIIKDKLWFFNAGEARPGKELGELSEDFDIQRGENISDRMLGLFETKKVKTQESGPFSDINFDMSVNHAWMQLPSFDGGTNNFNTGDSGSPVKIKDPDFHAVGVETRFAKRLGDRWIQGGHFTNSDWEIFTEGKSTFGHGTEKRDESNVSGTSGQIPVNGMAGGSANNIGTKSTLKTQYYDFSFHNGVRVNRPLGENTVLSGILGLVVSFAKVEHDARYATTLAGRDFESQLEVDMKTKKIAPRVGGEISQFIPKLNVIVKTGGYMDLAANQTRMKVRDCIDGSQFTSGCDGSLGSTGLSDRQNHFSVDFGVNAEIQKMLGKYILAALFIEYSNGYAPRYVAPLRIRDTASITNDRVDSIFYGVKFTVPLRLPLGAE